MRGLKTQEGSKFEAFFSLVQQEAAKSHSVFFLDCGAHPAVFLYHKGG